MAIHTETFQHVLETVRSLSIEEQWHLIEQLAHELESETSVTSFALIGRWPAISLSAEEIDEARQECWGSLG